MSELFIHNILQTTHKTVIQLNVFKVHTYYAHPILADLVTKPAESVYSRTRPMLISMGHKVIGQDDMDYGHPFLDFFLATSAKCLTTSENSVMAGEGC